MNLNPVEMQGDDAGFVQASKSNQEPDLLPFLYQQ